LHEAASNPQSLEIILSRLPENDRLTAVQQQDRYGETALCYADNKSLQVVFNLLRPAERFVLAEGFIEQNGISFSVKDELAKLTDNVGLQQRISAANTKDELLAHIQTLRNACSKNITNLFKAAVPKEKDASVSSTKWPTKKI
jgi:molybdopterin-guanine dinucleotide biosynthesis protein